MSLVPPDNVAKVAAKALEMRAEFGRGGTAVGVARATQLKNKVELSPRTVQRMVSYFARHEVDKKGKGFYADSEDYPSAGRIAWDLWGGDAGRTWAEEKLRSLERKDEGVIPMTDVRVLKGSEIRRIDGKYGTVKQVSLPWVTVEWTDGTTQSYQRSDESLTEDFEVKTLNDGWVSLGALVGTEKALQSFAEEQKSLDQLVADLRGIATNMNKDQKRAATEATRKMSVLSLLDGRAVFTEKSANNPFRNFKKLGDKTPRATDTHDEIKLWKCSGTADRQKCVAIRSDKDRGVKKGQVKMVIRSAARKASLAAWNREYAKGIAAGTMWPGARSGGKPSKKG